MRALSFTLTVEGLHLRGGWVSADGTQEDLSEAAGPEATYTDRDHDESSIYQAQEKWTDTRRDYAVVLNFEQEQDQPPIPSNSTSDWQQGIAPGLKDISFIMPEPIDVLPRF